MTSSAQLLPIPANHPRVSGEVWGGGSRKRGSMLISRLWLLPGHHTHTQTQPNYTLITPRPGLGQGRGKLGVGAPRTVTKLKQGPKKPMRINCSARE